MFTLPSLSDLLRDAIVIGILIFWLRRYLPWGRRSAMQPAALVDSDEIDLLWTGVEEIADRYNQTRLGREHMLWALLSTPGAQLDELLRQFPLDRLQARVRVAAVISGFPKQFLWRYYHQRLWLSQALQQTARQARREAEQSHAPQLTPLHLLLALAAPDPAPAAEEDGLAQKLLAELGLTRPALAEAMIRLNQQVARDATSNT